MVKVKAPAVVRAHLPMNRAWRRRQASISVKAKKLDLILAGIDPLKERKRLAKWDGVSVPDARKETAPTYGSWIFEKREPDPLIRSMEEGDGV